MLTSIQVQTLVLGVESDSVLLPLGVDFGGVANLNVFDGLSERILLVDGVEVMVWPEYHGGW